MQLWTAGGYEMGEVASALQKTIRRGLEKEAVFWAQELESKYPNYLWRRLVVIAHEEVGVADPQVVTFVETCRQHYQFMIENKTWENLPLINAVVALCRAKKSRLSISLHLLVYESDMKLEVPDYALDMHTARGRRMGRGIDHFHEHAIVLHPKDESCDPYEAEALAHGKNSTLRPWCKQRASEVREKKGGKKSEQMNLLDTITVGS